MPQELQATGIRWGDGEDGEDEGDEGEEEEGRYGEGRGENFLSFFL
jgi:hypothetical protein